MSNQPTRCDSRLEGRPRRCVRPLPTDPADNYGHLCTSYQHIGQHSGADYGLCIRNSRPATRREAAPLLTELRRIGYRPRVLQRASRRHHDERLRPREVWHEQTDRKRRDRIVPGRPATAAEY